MTAASDTTAPSLAIVGGGLAGLAAAAVAAEQGFRVEVFESRGRLGGRAGSFLDRPSGEWVDHCQHVSMGCCVNLADFCRRTGIDESFARYRRLHFLTAGGRQHSFSAATLLPAPLHLATGLLRLGYLSLPERWRIATGLVRLARKAAPDEDCQTVGRWLRRQGQSERAIEGFWSPVLVSALSETLDRASLPAARKVFVQRIPFVPRGL